MPTDFGLKSLKLRNKMKGSTTGLLEKLKKM
jgi:hypothetical protein